MIRSLTAGDRLGLMLFLATAFHLFFILGVTFELEDRDNNESRQQSLEVMVVHHPKEPPKEDEKADFLAQTSQAGGGEHPEKARPSTRAESLPAQIPAPQPQPLAEEQAKPESKKNVQQLTTRAESRQKTTTDDPTQATQPKPTTAQLFASKNEEIAHLTREIERKTIAYARLPRRKTISASTREYKYAAYLDAWRRKVERIGNLNYPDEAKRRKLYGNLILHVAVKKDGSISQIRVMRSSGHKLLDDAAIRIVRLAGPYSPFPQEIRQETDILDIIRTWQFLSSNQLLSK